MDIIIGFSLLLVLGVTVIGLIRYGPYHHVFRIACLGSAVTA